MLMHEKNPSVISILEPFACLTFEDYFIVLRYCKLYFLSIFFFFFFFGGGGVWGIALDCQSATVQIGPDILFVLFAKIIRDDKMSPLAGKELIYVFIFILLL